MWCGRGEDLRRHCLPVFGSTNSHRGCNGHQIFLSFSYIALMPARALDIGASLFGRQCNVEAALNSVRRFLNSRTTFPILAFGGLAVLITSPVRSLMCTNRSAYLRTNLSAYGNPARCAISSAAGALIGPPVFHINPLRTVIIILSFEFEIPPRVLFPRRHFGLKLLLARPGTAGGHRPNLAAPFCRGRPDVRMFRCALAFRPRRKISIAALDS